MGGEVGRKAGPTVAGGQIRGSGGFELVGGRRDGEQWVGIRCILQMVLRELADDGRMR